MEYQVKIVEDVSQEPVTLAEVKAWSQIDADYSSEDSNLNIMISSAREKLEGELNVAFAVKTLEVQFSGEFFKLPYGPTGNILAFFNVGDDPYADTEYTLHGLNFKSLAIGSYSASEWFYPIAGGYPRLWRNYERLTANTYNIIYTTGYTTLPRLLKEALLIQVDYDLKTRGMPGMSALSPVALLKASRYNQNLVL